MFYSTNFEQYFNNSLDIVPSERARYSILLARELSFSELAYQLLARLHLVNSQWNKASTQLLAMI